MVRIMQKYLVGINSQNYVTTFGMDHNSGQNYVTDTEYHPFYQNLKTNCSVNWKLFIIILTYTNIKNVLTE